MRSARSRPRDQWEFLERVAEEARQTGQPVPKAIAERPVVEPDFLEYWEAWAAMSGSRGAGFAPEPIKPSDVLAWCEMVGIPQWRRASFWRVLHTVDGDWLAEIADGNAGTAAGREQAGGGRQERGQRAR